MALTTATFEGESSFSLRNSTISLILSAVATHVPPNLCTCTHHAFKVRRHDTNFVCAPRICTIPANEIHGHILQMLHLAPHLVLEEQLLQSAQTFFHLAMAFGSGCRYLPREEHGKIAVMRVPIYHVILEYDVRRYPECDYACILRATLSIQWRTR